ncbi:hypothetical protein EPN95_01800 [Patescibacteria group bacterium]|nr:MAG: hypothetical protein EPN95_01800 [Patescibacteria group bacterium]
MTVVRLRADDVLYRPVSEVTVEEVQAQEINRLHVGTELGYEFEMYVGKDGVFAAKSLRNAPDEGSFPEGQVWVATTQKLLSVGFMMTLDQADPFLRVTRFVVAYIEVPYQGE